MLTDEGRRVVADVAQRHGVGADAVLALLMALVEGRGTQAQFNHTDLGGMGQWSQGGMIMVGDMFNQNLKYRVDALCNELAGLLRDSSLIARPRLGQSQNQSKGGGGVSLFVPGTGAAGIWWPAELGSPASVGAQNDLRYAFFPAARRLAIEQGGGVTVYDTVDHQIGGFSQQQGGDQTLTFTSQRGLVRVADLAVVPVATTRPAEPAPASPVLPPTAVAPASAPHPTVSVGPAPAAADDIFGKIERLAELRRKNILTDQEYETKKAELLSRI